MFGSQARPGMRSSSSLGSLSNTVFSESSLQGSTLGNSQNVMEALGEASPSTDPTPTSTAVEQAAQAQAAATSARNKKLLLAGGAAFAAWYFIFRKK